MTLHNVHVRPVVADDASAWLRMREALWPTEGGDRHAPEVAQFFDRTPRMGAEVLVAVDDGGVALGFVELSIRNYAEDCETDNVGYVEGWYVEAHARRRGVGRALIAAAEVWARQQGCTEFASDALIDNHASAMAHRALGFEETVQIRCFKKVLQ